MQTVPIRYSINSSDYVRAQWAHARRHRLGWFFYAVLRVIMPVLFVVALLVAILRPKESEAIVPALFFTAIFTAVLHSQPLLWKRQYAKIPSAQMQVMAEIGEQELRLTSARTDSTVQWEHFQGWVEGDELFLLYPRENLFNIIPKRAFTPEQLTEFRELLARKIPQKK